MGKLYSGHEVEMAAHRDQDKNMSIDDMRRSLISAVDEHLSKNEAFASIFGEKTPEDFASYLDEIARTATAFATRIRSGEYRA